MLPSGLQQGYQFACSPMCMKAGPLETSTAGTSFHLNMVGKEFCTHTALYLFWLDVGGSIMKHFRLSAIALPPPRNGKVGKLNFAWRTQTGYGEGILNPSLRMSCFIVCQGKCSLGVSLTLILSLSLGGGTLLPVGARLLKRRIFDHELGGRDTYTAWHHVWLKCLVCCSLAPWLDMNPKSWMLFHHSPVSYSPNT